MTQGTNDSIRFDLVVIGGGPGGYTAAFRAADLGMKVALVERYPVLGGVCLNVGCVPSKALLHIAQLLSESTHFETAGVLRGALAVDLQGLQRWKAGIVEKLNTGLSGLAKRRKIEVVHGTASFVSQTELAISGVNGEQRLQFGKAIVATGSSPIQLPFLPDDERIWNSTTALNTPVVPKRLLVIGGGVIGLEMATVYQALGSEVTVVELTDSLIPGVDKSTVRQLQAKLKKEFTLLLETKVTAASVQGDDLLATVDNKKGVQSIAVDNILVAVGRKPNSRGLGLEEIGIAVDDKGFISVDEQQRTNCKNIYAIGDVTPGPMLAHKASAEGRVAAEVCSGKDTKREYRCIPSVAYTHPELAVVGMSESSASAAGYSVRIGKFPFAANARAMTLESTAGSTKLIFDDTSGQLLGAELVGPNVGELISPLALAIQNQLTAVQIAATVHPHPSLSETILGATEVFEGTVTELFIPRK
ncbi:MAG: dihydrolipoyl dehydrogenase [Deltaproteobacteria bacterium]|nr:dihydrolipoyl dehydrogenase [Deltaproteobacteria bacterium]MBN2673666.1 dihydrolipoyl dehydrogenase [Deltaproteobacteria bacterium]